MWTDSTLRLNGLKMMKNSLSKESPSRSRPEGGEGKVPSFPKERKRDSLPSRPGKRKGNHLPALLHGRKPKNFAEGEEEEYRFYNHPSPEEGGVGSTKTFSWPGEEPLTPRLKEEKKVQFTVTRGLRKKTEGRGVNSATRPRERDPAVKTVSPRKGE